MIRCHPQRTSGFSIGSWTALKDICLKIWKIFACVLGGSFIAVTNAFTASVPAGLGAVPNIGSVGALSHSSGLFCGKTVTVTFGWWDKVQVGVSCCVQ